MKTQPYLNPIGSTPLIHAQTYAVINTDCVMPSYTKNQLIYIYIFSDDKELLLGVNVKRDGPV